MSKKKKKKKQDLLQALPNLLDIDYVHGTIKGLVNSYKERYLMRFFCGKLRALAKWSVPRDWYSSKLGTLYALLHFECLLSESMERGSNWSLHFHSCIISLIVRALENLSLDIIILQSITLNIYTNKCSVSISLSCPRRFSKAHQFYKCNFRDGN